MSAIINLGTHTLANALRRFNTERYEGCSGCEHVMNQLTGEWLPFSAEVHATAERDSFGPGEVTLLCEACAARAASTERCSFCSHEGDDVTGYQALDESMFYNYCPACWDKHVEANTDSQDQDDFAPYETGYETGFWAGETEEERDGWYCRSIEPQHPESSRSQWLLLRSRDVGCLSIVAHSDEPDLLEVMAIRCRPEELIAYFESDGGPTVPNPLRERLTFSDRVYTDRVGSPFRACLAVLEYARAQWNDGAAPSPYRSPRSRA